ncbi:MAG: cyclic nucleotide-binding domain-containing protein [Coprobacillus cateniformis]
MHLRKSYICKEDDAKNLYLITKGRVRIYVMNPTGEEVTLEIVDKGRIFGESSFYKIHCAQQLLMLLQMLNSFLVI